LSETLAAAQRAYTEAVAIAERLREARDTAILFDLADRVLQKEIMETTGLSRARIDQIRRGTR